MAELSDIELAVSYWLPKLWQPGMKCPIDHLCEAGQYEFYGREEDCTPEHGHAIHDLPCPPLTRDLGMRLLEAMLKQTDVGFEEMEHIIFCVTDDDTLSTGDDLLTAIVRAAALARKEKP